MYQGTPLYLLFYLTSADVTVSEASGVRAVGPPIIQACSVHLQNN